MALKSTVFLPAPTPAAPLRWLIESRTTAGVLYQVSQITETAWSCTCPAGQNGRCCWHVRQCQDEIRQLRADLAAGVQIVDDGGRREPCGICDQMHTCHCSRLQALCSQCEAV